VVKKAKETSAPVGRPTIYSEEMIAVICARIADGESMRSIARDDSMPAMTTMFRWLGESEQFKKQYAIAMAQRAEGMFEDMIEIADEECTFIKKSKHGSKDDGDEEVEVAFDPTAVARNRLRVDTRKWMLAKMVPKRYGDKQEVEHTSPDGSMTPAPAIQVTAQMIQDIASKINDGI